MKLDREQIEQYIEDCEGAMTARNSPFNDWEREFIESVAERWETSHHLTEGQQDKLEQIWDKL